MPANEVTANTNTEELRPPASVLRTLAFARARGARSSAPDADGTVRTTGIGGQGLAAEALARSLSARALSPLTLGSPDWLTALLRRHQFAAWSLGLPNLYYFHWLRAAAEEATADGSTPTVPTTFTRSALSPISPATVALRTASVAQASAGRPTWAGSAPPSSPTPEFALARRRPASLPDEDEPALLPDITSKRIEAPRSVPLLPDTLNATHSLPPVLTLHADTAQARPAAWTEPSLMQFAAPEVMAAWIARRTETPSRPSPAALERAADSPYMPVSYPPVPLASWLGVAASAPEKAYWETAPGFIRAQFSPASSHLLVLPKIAAGDRTQPDFDNPALTAFASLPRLAAIQTPAQFAGAASASVQTAQNAAIQPTRPSWPPSPMTPAVSPSVAPTPVSIERQAREPSTEASEEPAAARRSPLAAARTALEVVQRFGTQAAQTFRIRAFQPLLTPTPDAGPGRAPSFAALPFLRSLPRLRRPTEAGDSDPMTPQDTFFGVPSLVRAMPRATETLSPVPASARLESALPVPLEQLVALRHQRLSTNASPRPQTSADLSFGEFVAGDAGAWDRLPSEWIGLPLPLVSRARLAAHLTETDERVVSDAEAAETLSPKGPSQISSQIVETAAPTASRPASAQSITDAVLTRATTLINSLVTRAEGNRARSAGIAPTPDIGNPFAAMRSFLGQFLLPRRRDTALPEAQATVTARAGDGSTLAAPGSFPASRSTAAAGPPTASAASGLPPTVLSDLPLARRLRTTRFPDTQEAQTQRPFRDNLPGIITAPQAQHPVDFSAGVASRYLETAADAPGVPPSAPMTPRASSVEGDLAPLLPMLSALGAPLRRFLRLGDLRGVEGDTAGIVQTGEGRRLGSPGVVTAAATSPTGAVSAGQTVGMMSRIVFPGPDGEPAPALPTLSTLAAPLRRFLRLGNLGPAESDAAEIVRGAGIVSKPPAAIRPIFGGIPSPFQPTAAGPAARRGPTDAPTTAFRQFATLFATLPLPVFPRRTRIEDPGQDSAPWTPTVGSVPAASPARATRSAEEYGFDAPVPAATPMQRFLSRWASPSTSPGVSQDARWSGGLSLPKRPAAVPFTETAFGLATGPSFGSAASSENASTSVGIPSGTLPFAKRRTGVPTETGGIPDAVTGEDGTTSVFQAQLLAPIREFLLSTLSRLLSPLEALGQMPDGGQIPEDESGRAFRPDAAPGLLWWSPPAETGANEMSDALTGRHEPSRPVFGLPTLSSSFSQPTGDSEGMGIQRRVALEAPHQTGFAHAGLLALRLASERMSRSLNGRPAGPTAEGVAQTTAVSGLHRPSPQQRLPGRPSENTAPRIGGNDFAPTAPVEADTNDLVRSVLGLRPLSLPLPLPNPLLNREGEDGPVRGDDRLLTQALGNLPTKDPMPVGAGQEPAWLGRRGGSALAERVPAMPLPLRGEQTDTSIPAAMRDPYVIQRAASGTAVAAPAPHSTGETADTTDVDHGHGHGHNSDVNAMASEVWTLLRRRMAREAARSGHR